MLKLNSIFAIILFLASISSASNELTPEMIMNMKFISSAKISPNGKYVAYSKVFMAPENEGTKYRYYELWVMNLETKKSKLYATKEEPAKSYVWSKDSEFLYFLSKRPKYHNKSQIYCMPVAGGVAKLLTEHSPGIISFKLSKEEDKIAFISKMQKTKEQEERIKNGEDWIINEEDFTYQYLYTFDLKTKKTEQISPDKMHVFNFVWEPDGKHLIYQAATRGLTDYSYMFRDLFRISLSEKIPELLCKHDGRLGNMTVSPDGKYLAFLGAVDISDPTHGSLLITEIGTGKWENISPDFIGTIRDIDWLNNNYLVFCAETYNHTSVYKINTISKKIEKLFGKGNIFKSVQIANDKNTFVCSANNYNHPDELFYGKIKTKTIERLTYSNPNFSAVDFYKPEEFKWMSRDNVEIRGFVIKPDKFKTNGKAPLYVYVHGGPEGVRQVGWNNRYNNWPQIMAQKGFVVFIPNYRGSTGRGVQFTKADQGDMMGVDFDDVLDGIDALVNLNWVDPNKVGIVGGSYGGYMAAWASTKYSDRFAAAVMSCGISNQVSKIGLTDTPHENSLVHWIGYHWESNFDLAWDRSPLKYFKNHNTPLLIAHGSNDKRVPVGQAYELYRALNHLKQSPVELIIYPDEGHGYKKRAHRYHFMNRGIEWLEKYVLNNN